MRNAWELHQALLTVNFSVVESRREGHEALNEFVGRGVAGSTLFGIRQRFPDGETDQFVCSMSRNLQRVIAGLQSTLNWRLDNVAKDVQAGQGASARPDPNYTERNQEGQDTKKKFEEMVNSFGNLLVTGRDSWYRESFETRTSAVWVP